ncbi:MAG: hypothetical protein HQK88_04075 [Nitrospirae bacterium]|nr:hypothetical protein [Nitrospirota bacterium]MBF0533495.1 hypothetical protein [Nitrospirota bacterium]MBF0615981.1 hypothetical protein [Nitrospirota bacterium]
MRDDKRVVRDDKRVVRDDKRVVRDDKRVVRDEKEAGLPFLSVCPFSVIPAKAGIQFFIYIFERNLV